MRKSSLGLAVAQPSCESLAVERNAAAHAEAIRRARARVVVFPELSLTGYELQAPALLPDDPRLTTIVRACDESDALALVGVPLQGQGAHVHIAMLAVTGTGCRVAYRKVWLGEEEAGRFSPGAGPAVLDVDGWRLGLGICKDTGIAEHAAATAALGIDAYVAGIVINANEVDEHDARARRIARDHGVPVAFASFAGATGGGYDNAAGRSAIWSGAGEVIVRSGPESGEIATATFA